MDVSEYLHECLLGLHKTTQSKDYQLRNLQNRKNTMNNLRRDKRTNIMYEKRQISDNMTPINTPDVKNVSNVRNSNNLGRSSINTKPNKRLELLAKWKAEKEQRLQQIKMKSKPVFKVCHVPDKIGLPDFEKMNNENKGKSLKKNPTPSKSNFAPPGHIFKPPSNIKPLPMNKGKPTAASNSRAKKLDFRDMSKLNLKASTINKSPQRITRSTSKDKATSKPKAQVTINQMKKVNETQNTKVNRNMISRTNSVETLSLSKTKSALKKTTSIENLPSNSTNQLTTKKSEKPKTKEPRNNKVEHVEKTPNKPQPVKTKTPKKIKTPYKTKGWTVEYNGDDSEDDSVVKENSIKLTPSEKLQENDLKTPEKSNMKKGTEETHYISPFVTISRGKNSARKEFQIRNSIGHSESPLIELKDSSQFTSPRAGAAYFTQKLNREISRIEGMCDEWQSVRDSEDLPSEAHDMIDVAIGQSKLLISKKFEQFRGLIQQCRDCEYKEKPITCKDLHGFWDMIYMQVEDLDKRFNNLQKIKNNNWEEILPEKKTTAPIKRTQGRAPTKKQASSILKAMIKAARNKKMDNLPVEESIEQKTFNGGYFAVQSPIKVAPPVKTPSKTDRKSLRLSVLSKEVNKRISSPGMTMMKISQAIKSGDGITPSKSILKTDGSKSAKKSVLFKEDILHECDTENTTLTKTVLFNDDDELENDVNQINIVTPVRKSTRLKKV